MARSFWKWNSRGTLKQTANDTIRAEQSGAACHESFLGLLHCCYDVLAGLCQSTWREFLVFEEGAGNSVFTEYLGTRLAVSFLCVLVRQVATHVGQDVFCACVHGF